jgi:ABC-type branched-subunit amino acid transport system substrate-binding protein
MSVERDERERHDFTPPVLVRNVPALSRTQGDVSVSNRRLETVPGGNDAMRTRLLVLAIIVSLVAIGCSNSSSTGKSSSTIPKGATETTVNPADLGIKHTVRAQGVTDAEIDVNAVVTATGSPTGSFAPFADGIRTYFNMINSGGGIYGRQLKLTHVYDDQLGNNSQMVTKALADKTFATFGASVLFTGATLLARANQPTFIWNINPEMAGKNNIFANLGALCFNCPGHILPWLAKQLNATKVGIIGYGVSQESKDCAAGIKASFVQYPTAQVVYSDDSLPFAAPLAADVTAMKNKGVQLVGTCIDINESFTLGKEMQRQGLNAVQSLPNGYDRDFMAKNGAALEGSLVGPQYVVFEHQPQIPEVQKFLDWAQRTGVSVKETTAAGWQVADEFVTGLKLAGPDFTQQKVIDGLNTLTHYDDNGFIPPIDWTKQHNDPEKDPASRSTLECGNFVKVTGSKFQVVYDEPGKPWTCFNRTDPNVDNPQHLNFATG